MKKIIFGSILTAGILLTGNAHANSIDKSTEAHLVKICEAIKSDNALKLHHAIKNSGVRARIIGQGLVCNGYDPVSFAIVNNAKTTAKFMARKSGVDYETLLAKL
jgi:hypothetical protein